MKLALLLLTAHLAPAAVIVATGTPDPNLANGRGFTIFRTADDFTLPSAATIDSVRFWMLASTGTFSGSVSYAFHQNAGGALGSLITSGSIANVTPAFQNQVPGNIHNLYIGMRSAIPSLANERGSRLA